MITVTQLLPVKGTSSPSLFLGFAFRVTKNNERKQRLSMHMDFLRRRLKQNSNIVTSFCMQQVNIGCELLRVSASGAERVGERRECLFFYSCYRFAQNVPGFAHPWLLSNISSHIASKMMFANK